MCARTRERERRNLSGCGAPPEGGPPLMPGTQACCGPPFPLSAARIGRGTNATRLDRPAGASHGRRAFRARPEVVGGGRRRRRRRVVGPCVSRGAAEARRRGGTGCRVVVSRRRQFQATALPLTAHTISKSPHQLSRDSATNTAHIKDRRREEACLEQESARHAITTEAPKPSINQRVFPGERSHVPQEAPQPRQGGEEGEGW